MKYKEPDPTYPYILRSNRNFNAYVGVCILVPTIRRRNIDGRTYYYLEHSMRRDGQVQKRELYLGKSLPRDVEARKRAFMDSIYREKWYPVLERIKKGYDAEQRRTPPSGREKEISTFTTLFTYDTQRIEGSTLSLRETADVLDRGMTPPSRPLTDIKEAEAHRNLFRAMLREPRNLSLSLVLDWHHALFRDSKPDIAGKIRQHQVTISGSRFMPPSPVEIYPLLKDFFRWYARSKSRAHPVELAALVHLKLVTIHPFTDGNGRMARLLMNFVLHRHGYPMLNIPYTGRARYYTALERAQAKGLEGVFVLWFLRFYEKANRRYVTH